MGNLSKLAGVLAAGLLLLNPLAAWADWAGFSGYTALAEVAIQPDRLVLNLRMPADSLPRLAARIGETGDATPEHIASRLLLIQDGQGRILPGGSEPRVAQGVMTMANGASVGIFEATLEIPLSDPLDVLKLSPPAGTNNEIGLMVLHRGVPLADLAPLSRPLVVRLNEVDPWRSALDEPGLVRRHAQPRSFLYVEPFEVRHEVLLRLADLQRLLQIPLRDENRLAEEEKAKMAAAIGRLLKERTRLQADGIPLTADSQQVEFVGFTRTGVLPLPEGPVDVQAALVGIVLAYLTEKPAQSVSLTWNLFSQDATEWPVTVIHGQESFDSYVTPSKATFDWSRDDGFDTETGPPETASAPLPPLSEPDKPRSPERRLATLIALLLPVSAWYLWLLNPHRRYGGLALAASIGIGAIFGFYPAFERAHGSAGLDETYLRKALPPLLHNAYRAFQLRNEEAVYDRLALSLDGILLEETYLQQRRALLRQSKGLGGMGQVDRIELQRVEVLPARDASISEVSVEWIAHGTVSHWGHSHPRHNRYRARLKLQTGSDRHPKIIAMEFLDGQTLGSGSSS